ncbi:hypothetical protein HYPBUDRAFT_206496 [Hyphopichia burtonii NRRL Y-1933]|uniref:Uncharacterized protein n=1 Tax=Hyphopichia burtonii NRRL Y-1933 TaxID=984485 RepID=A0A1E4RIA6_9ASCO|nr:hypothetical protein HYPBUDRAFT_206496 [Hyphopichia burtonii NRRL Y-1933]ODV66970.1 hypothetical protein HYPBUDRAFT_206496 [Hyphopichia burtonii NRRL Y-1933]
MTQSRVRLIQVSITLSGRPSSSAVGDFRSRAAGIRSDSLSFSLPTQLKPGFQFSRLSQNKIEETKWRGKRRSWPGD